MKVAMLGLKGIPTTYGGVERCVEEISTRLVERGHEVTVFNRINGEPAPSEYKGVSIKGLPYIKEKHLEMASHTLLSSVVTLLKPFDIVHFHSVDPTLFAFISKLRHPIVATSQGQAYRRAKWGRFSKWVSKRSELMFINVSNARTSVSQTLKKYYEDTYKKPVTYIPNGATPKPVTGLAALERHGLKPGGYILFSGRLEPTKGCHVALEAYNLAKRPEPFVIMGVDTYTDRYAEGLRRLASGNGNIRFIGHQLGDDYWQILQNAKAFVFPSAIEGLSLNLLEALCHGVPVIYSDIPENREVANGVAMEFKLGDVNDMAEKYGMLLDDPQLMQRFSEQSRERIARDFGWDKIVADLEGVYQSVLK